MLIYLVRHARPHAVDGVCYGRRNVPVRPSETDRAARSLRSQIPEDVLRTAPVYSSPLERCAVLARQIAGGRSVAVTPALLELDFGSWQGRSWNDIPREELDAWAADLWRYAPGSGESAAAAAQRWRSWVDSLLGQSLDTVIAVTHAGLIRVAHAVESASDLTLLAMDVAYGSAHRLIARAACASGARPGEVTA
jgi:alpha-ribazole phosphatase